MSKNLKKSKYKNIAGDDIRKIRLAAIPVVTQEDLAGKLATQGILLDRSALSRIESRTRYLMDYEIVAIAKALKVTVSDILTD